ncbi:hypothetical protein [Streptomyces sp. NPDC002990]
MSATVRPARRHRVRAATCGARRLRPDRGSRPGRDPQGGRLNVPYEVMRWFMDQVEVEIRTSRAWMRLRPELVEVIHRLRQEHLGAVHDDDFPRVLVEVRTAVPAADLPAVLASAFGRKPDGAPVGF